MCGIVGLVGPGSDASLGRRMRDTLRHRGPDGWGEWGDRACDVWLGHRRLAILDLTAEGQQPMRSPSGRYVMTYNGEVFNHDALREELRVRGVRFRGRSDTEVMLAAIDEWGLEAAIQRFVGMFVFGLWDRETARLWLVRDRLGIKPLYYAQSAGRLAFASELRALGLLPWVDDEVDADALAAYFRYLYVPEPATIIRGARKVQPGATLCWDGRSAVVSRYWSIADAVRAGRENPLTGRFEDAVDELDSRLRDAVRLRMRADVPLGAFLSGGVDSSTVVAHMQAQSRRPIQTFTIGFTERSHDESPHARAVAQHLGTDHHEEILTPAQVIELVPRVAELHDEPFGDGSSVPTYLLSRFARQAVTVALSGDGGDELFGGYPRYYWASRIERWQRRLDRFGVRRLARLGDGIPAALWDRPVSWLVGNGLPDGQGLGARARRFFRYVASSPERVYDEIFSAWARPSELMIQPSGVRLGPDPTCFAFLPWSEQMMATDQENQLVGDFLCKLDRASMAVSLEARVPLLDHRLVEWSWRVPSHFKTIGRGDRGKRILRAVLERYVPRAVIDRPKIGFGMPMGRWLRNELRPWAEDLLRPGRLGATGILQPGPIAKVWREQLTGADRLPQIWTVLMFLQWHELWKKSPIEAAPDHVTTGS
jgi:asparagine synthase (glutamine-hydrolysing)